MKGKKTKTGLRISTRRQQDQYLELISVAYYLLFIFLLKKYHTG